MKRALWVVFGAVVLAFIAGAIVRSRGLVPYVRVVPALTNLDGLYAAAAELNTPEHRAAVVM